MDFDRPPQLPPDVAAQLSRVSKAIAGQQASASVDREVVPTYPDIETFLERHSEVFSTTEEYWRSVKKAGEALDELSGMRVAASKGQLGDDGKVHVEYKQAQGINRTSQRRLEQRYRGFNTHTFIGQMSDIAHEHVAGEVSKGLFIGLPETYQLRDIADEAIGFTLEGSDRDEAVAEHMVQIGGKASEDVTSRSEPLVDGLMRAFLGQYIGMYHIQTLLADDQHVIPFVERLQEMAALSERGSVEFPGLLETVEAHIAGSHINKRENVIRSALHRVSGKLFSRHAFVSAIVDPASGITLPPGHNFSKKFMGSLDTAQSIAHILGENAAVAPADIAKYIVEDFSQMPEVWHVTYESIRERAFNHVWDNLAAALHPFYRSGRLSFGAEAARKKINEPASKSAGRGNPGHKRVSMSQLSRNPVDFVSEVEPEAATFAILGIDDDNRGTFALERVMSLEHLMQTDMVAALLQRQPELADDLKTFLGVIADDPYSVSKPLADKGRARIKDAGVENVVYPIRQFTASKIAAGGVSERAGRIRISFTVSIVDHKPCIALQNVSLSDAEMS